MKISWKNKLLVIKSAKNPTHIATPYGTTNNYISIIHDNWYPYINFVDTRRHEYHCISSLLFLSVSDGKGVHNDQVI